MPKVTYIVAGEATTIGADAGESVMMTAVQNGIDGIVAECGGSMSCATCHVYVADEWFDRTGSAGADESDMLEGATSERRQTSRLSCQIEMCDELDGLVVHVPPEQ